MTRIESYLTWTNYLPRIPEQKRLLEILKRNPQGARLSSIAMLMQQPKRTVEKALQRLESQGVVRLVYFLKADDPDFTQKMRNHTAKKHTVRVAEVDNRLWDLVQR